MMLKLPAPLRMIKINPSQKLFVLACIGTFTTIKYL